jgi:lipopolysaccharide export system protein LptC
VSPQTVTHNELVNPKFQSEDSHSQPYTITADKATQNAEDMDTVILQKPVADMTLKSGGWVSLKADNGAYKQSTGNLDLDGQVEVHHDSGYEIHTNKMNIDVTGQTILSDGPVTGHGPAADITANGLQANGNDDTLIFKGPAKLTLRKAQETSPSSQKEPQ